MEVRCARCVQGGIGSIHPRITAFPQNRPSVLSDHPGPAARANCQASMNGLAEQAGAIGTTTCFPQKQWVLQGRPRQCGLAGPVEATRTLLIQPDGFLGGRIRRAYPAGEQTFELAFKTACETFRRRTTRRKWHWDQPPTRATC